MKNVSEPTIFLNAPGRLIRALCVTFKHNAEKEKGRREEKKANMEKKEREGEGREERKQ